MWWVGSKDAPSRGLPLCHGSARLYPERDSANTDRAFQALGLSLK
jgi:hypothetical protein